MFTRHRWQNPGALAVRVRSGGWGGGESTETTATHGSRCPPWPVTTYAQLTHVLEMLPPLDRHLYPEHFLVFWIGGEEVFSGGDESSVLDETLAQFAYRRFPGASFCKDCTAGYEKNRELKIKVAADLLWAIVGEATVPST